MSEEAGLMIRCQQEHLDPSARGGSKKKREGAGEPPPAFDPDDPNGKKKQKLKRARVDASTSTRPIPCSFQTEIKAEERSQAELPTDGIKMEQEGEEEEGDEQSRPVRSATVYGNPNTPAERAALIRKLLESQEAVRYLEKADSFRGLTPAEYKRWFDAWFAQIYEVDNQKVSMAAIIAFECDRAQRDEQRRYSRIDPSITDQKFLFSFKGEPGPLCATLTQKEFAPLGYIEQRRGQDDGLFLSIESGAFIHRDSKQEDGSHARMFPTCVNPTPTKARQYVDSLRWAEKRKTKASAQASETHRMGAFEMEMVNSFVKLVTCRLERGHPCYGMDFDAILSGGREAAEDKFELIKTCFEK